MLFAAHEPTNCSNRRFSAFDASLVRSEGITLERLILKFLQRLAGTCCGSLVEWSREGPNLGHERLMGDGRAKSLQQERRILSL